MRAEVIKSRYQTNELKGKDPEEYLDLNGVYRDEFISQYFGGSRQKGIKRPADSKHVFVFSKKGNGYSDEYLEDIDVLLYHGADYGTSGGSKDQIVDLSSGNQYLVDAYIRGDRVFLFRDPQGDNTRYKGVKTVFMEPFYEKPLEDKGRKLVFPLIDKSKWDSMDDSARSALVESVRSRATVKNPEPIPHLPKKKTQIYSIFARKQSVKEEALEYANGICQLCDKEGPFTYNGRPFLEAHHIKPLSEGGLDSLENVVALCPNCHRKVHLAPDAKDVEKMKKRANPTKYVG